MHTLIQMQSVDPADPFGRKDRHRTCRIVIQRGEDLRALCWFRLGLDQSIYFGVPGVTAGVLGKAAFQADSRLTSVAPERSLSDLPSAACKDFHLSLHPSGHVHLRAHGAKPFATDDMGTWLPVTKVRNWAYFFSEPLDRLSLVTQLRRRDAVVAFPEGNASVEVHVDLIPSAQPYPLHSKALDTVIGLSPPHYGLRVSVFPYKLVNGTIFFASRESVA